jgi:hypothetical protein
MTRRRQPSTEGGAVASSRRTRLGALVVAVAASAGVSGCDAAGSRPATEKAAVAGAVLEPTPYPAPSSTERLVRAQREPFADEIEPGQLALRWELAEVREGGRVLVIDYSPGCEDDRGAVQIDEKPDYVLVRVVHPEPVAKFGCVLTWRRIVELAEPLAGRQLLHAT